MVFQSNAARWLKAKIVRRVQESSRIISLELMSLDGADLPAFDAGSHIDVRISPGIVRQYSLCNDPAERHRYRIGVLLEEASRGGSAEIHGGFMVGREIDISEPKNAFAIRKNAARSLLLAGGVGVTPLIAMAHTLQRTNAEFEFHYCARTRENAAFAHELLEGRCRDRVVMHYDDGIAGQRFSATEVLKQVVPGAHIYVCGPAGFIDGVIKVAAFAGWQADQIHFERFSAVPLMSEGFTIVAKRSGREIEVVPGQRISEALRAADIEIEISCEAGVCGTCFTSVLEGIPDHQDSFQTEAEKAANTGIAICCSGSKTRRMVLDL